jgi:hypothetical protein
LSDKPIALIGAGIGATVINSTSAFNVYLTRNPASFRISGMTLQGGDPNFVVRINSADTSAATKGWRIDNVRFNYNGYGTVFLITGITWGLIDHSVFDGTGYQIASIFGYLNSEGSGTSRLSGDGYWNRPLALGTDEAVYFEDISVNFRGNSPHVFDLQFGGSAVLRHSTIRHNYFITHSARGNSRGGMKYEVYNNTFIGDGFYRVAQLRSGTGVIFNNSISGYGNNNFDIDNQRSSGESGCSAVSSPLGACNGSSSYDGNSESNGWPCLDQIGRGGGAPKAQPSVPLYTWNNGSSVAQINGACQSSGSWVRASRDYVNNGSTAKAGYTPYVYPHPLASGTAPPPAPAPTPLSPPANLVVQ